MSNPDALVECVPNFSEGRDPEVIRQITAEIEAVGAVRLLDVDPGRATNRTVVTFVGPPEAVVEAAFRAIAKAALVIDMRTHTGEHPRMGATDVCPLVPVANITMAETVALAHRLAERVGTELGIPVYLYEHAASRPERRNLATIRAGEYEGLTEKMARPDWAPDFGPAEFKPRVGATVIGAREFLVAYNVNLNTTSTRRANSVAFDVREKGRPVRVAETGEIARDEAGREVWTPGTLKGVKAIGWYIEEYGIAQVSMNLTSLEVTPLHVAFEEARKAAAARGLRATGSEIVGVVPLAAILDAGRYFLARQQRSLGVSEAELVAMAVRSLGLSDLAPFDPQKKVIEYILRDPADRPLAATTLEAFADATASEAPAPGGGSVAAAVGALGAALGTMVANLSAHKRGWDERWEFFSGWAVRGQESKDALLRLVDADTVAFDALMAAHRLPKGSAEDAAARAEAIEAATRRAIDVPLEVMRQAVGAMAVMEAMAAEGMASSISDAGVGAVCARAAARGAYLNVQINAAGLADREAAARLLADGAALVAQAETAEARVLARVEERIAGEP